MKIKSIFLFYFSNISNFFSNLYLFFEEHLLYFSFWFQGDVVFFSFLFVFKLTLVWFFVVWLRLNMLRLRFDQVASYTWHELVIYTVWLLVHTLLLNFLL